MVHKLTAGMVVLDCEISEIRLLLERHAGVLLDKTAESLSAEVAEYLESRHMNSAGELLGRLRNHSGERDALLERLLPGDTSFFRCPGALEAFRRRVLPELKLRKKHDIPRSLRIWSAGCSSGEEAYSIAISVCEALNGDGGGWNVHIVASDIRLEALASAERGLYPRRALKNVPPHLITTYFSRVGDHFLVKPRLLNLVTFMPMNLARANFIGRFDSIFCMDVLPHFSLSQRTALVERLHLYLEPGGCLFLGPREKLPASGVNFTTQSYLSCDYYQRQLAAAAKSGK
jgi:chemotaxis methyl-accepting protein methylase